MSQARRQLGQAGEDLAARWYLDRGYTILERNWRCREGEIDIIAMSDRVLVFCEVKARRSAAFGLPFEAVTTKKQLRLRKLASMYLSTGQKPFRSDLRFDVVSILGDDVEVIEAAF